MIRITPGAAVDEQELQYQFVRASGPGGQKVNKASTAVQLRFDAAASPGLSEEVRRRLRELSGRRMTAEGVLVIEASRHRSQRRNREEARQRLLALLRQAAQRRRHRRPSTPGAAQRERRMRNKHERSELKRLRSRPRVNGD